MINLLRKDFRAGALYLLGIVLLLPIITILTIGTMIDVFGGIIMSYFIFIPAGLCIAASFLFIGIDSAYETDMTYASLPIKRSMIVYTRYISSFILALSSWILVIFTCYISMTYLNKIDRLLEMLISFRGFFVMAIFLLLVISFLQPFIFRFGTGKGIIAVMFFMFCLFLIFQIGRVLLRAINVVFKLDLSFIERFIQDILQWMFQLEAFEVYSWLAGIVLFVILMSVTISILLYNRRDL